MFRCVHVVSFFRLANIVTFAKLVPGDQYQILIQVFSKGSMKSMHRNFTVSVAIQPPKPMVIDNSVFLTWTDFSLNFECSFFEGYTEVRHCNHIKVDQFNSIFFRNWR